VSWLTLAVRAEAAYAEALSEALLAHGALSVDMLDADADTPDEQAIFGEPGEPTSAVWQHNLVNALFESDADVADILQACCSELGLAGIPEHRIETLEESDWVRLTQAQFDPIRISGRLWIVPTWHEPTDPAAINIALDPGLAFGTGSHPTTRLCLRWLDANINGGESVLDYGCGSGILAIAAAGAARAVGGCRSQADRQPRQCCREPGRKRQFYQPDNAPQGSSENFGRATVRSGGGEHFDQPAAHAFRAGECDAARRADRAVRHPQEQAQDVMNIYRQWFDLNAPIFEEGWSCLSGGNADVKRNNLCPHCDTRFKTPQRS
jgi:ribosomal protein L11 methyltransferase